MLTPLLAGLGLGFSLIVAIGAQNLFVLRQGIRREHVFVVAAICALSDAVLIVLGVSGVGLVLLAAPWLIDVVRWAGAIFLVAYGLMAARRAWKASKLEQLEISLYALWPGSQTSKSYVFAEAKPISPVQSRTRRNGKPNRSRMLSAWLVNSSNCSML